MPQPPYCLLLCPLVWTCGSVACNNMSQGAYSGGKLTGMPALEEKNTLKKYLKSTKNTFEIYQSKKYLAIDFFTLRNTWFIIHYSKSNSHSLLLNVRKSRTKHLRQNNLDPKKIPRITKTQTKY